MKFVILSLLICCFIHNGYSFPSTFHLKLKNLCPNATFTFNQNGVNYNVNSYYAVDYTYNLKTEKTLEIPFIDFQKYFINSAKLINVLREVFNAELTDLYHNFIVNEAFLKRNLTIKRSYFEDIIHHLESFKKELHRSKEGMKDLNGYIEFVQQAKSLTTMLQKTQEHYTYNTFFNSSKFDKSFFMETNDQTELAIFDFDELMTNIHDLGINKYNKVNRNDNDQIIFTVKFYVPFQSKHNELFDCTPIEDLPIFYQKKGLEFIERVNNRDLLNSLD